MFTAHIDFGAGCNKRLHFFDVTPHTGDMKRSIAESPDSFDRNQLNPIKFGKFLVCVASQDFRHIHASLPELLETRQATPQLRFIQSSSFSSPLFKSISVTTMRILPPEFRIRQKLENYLLSRDDDELGDEGFVTARKSPKTTLPLFAA